jgi:hypothetical protein
VTTRNGRPSKSVAAAISTGPRIWQQAVACVVVVADSGATIKSRWIAMHPTKVIYWPILVGVFVIICCERFQSEPERVCVGPNVPSKLTSKQYKKRLYSHERMANHVPFQTSVHGIISGDNESSTSLPALPLPHGANGRRTAVASCCITVLYSLAGGSLPSLSAAAANDKGFMLHRAVRFGRAHRLCNNKFERQM